MIFLVLKMLNNLIALNYMYLHEKYHMTETLCQCSLQDLFGGWVILLTIELKPINRTFDKSGLLYKTITSL